MRYVFEYEILKISTLSLSLLKILNQSFFAFHKFNNAQSSKEVTSCGDCLFIGGTRKKGGLFFFFLRKNNENFDRLKKCHDYAKHTFLNPRHKKKQKRMTNSERESTSACVQNTKEIDDHLHKKKPNDMSLRRRRVGRLVRRIRFELNPIGIERERERFRTISSPSFPIYILKHTYSIGNVLSV